MKQVLQMTGVLLLQCGMGPDLVWQTDMANSLPVLVNIGVRKKTRERRICRYFELYNCHASWRCTNWDLTNDISKAISFDYRSTNDVLGLIRCCSALPTDRSFGEFITEAPLLRSDKDNEEQPSIWHTSCAKAGPREASCRISFAANEERGNMTKGAG